MRDQLGKKEKELREELSAAKLREAELQRIQAETRGRLDELRKDYDESQHNLGNARLAWKALVRNLKHEEGRNREMIGEMAELNQKLERYAVVDDVEGREAVVARKEVVVGNIDEHEAALAALRAELEPKLARTVLLEAELEGREAELARREAAVAEREAFLLKRDGFYGQQAGGVGGQPAQQAGGGGGRVPLRSTPNSNFRGGDGGRHGGGERKGAGGGGGGMTMGVSGNMVISAMGAMGGGAGPGSRGSSASSDSSGGYGGGGGGGGGAAESRRRASSFKPRAGPRAGLQRPVMAGYGR